MDFRSLRRRGQKRNGSSGRGVEQGGFYQPGSSPGCCRAKGRSLKLSVPQSLHL